MLNVQNYNLVSAKPSFLGKEKKDNKPEQKYFQTHAGLKTGAVCAGLGTAGTLTLAFLFKKSPNFIKNYSKELAIPTTDVKDLSKMVKNCSKGFLLYTPFFVAAALGCGAIVDKVINNKRAAFAEKVEKDGKDKALRSEDNADVTYKKNIYYKSNVGKTVGTALGVVVLPILSVILTLLCKMKVKPSAIISRAVTAALDGLILGAITDSFANKGARKFADMQASKNENK